MGGVLEGVRVLDFGRYIAGPYCATLLAEFGAEVIRVEKREGSEDRFVAPVGENGEGALFLQIIPAQNRRSARRLGELEPKLIGFGHGPPLRNPRQFIDYVNRLDPD